MCLLLMESATASVRTSKVVGMPFRAQTDAKARPKFPPPTTAILTGKGGGEDAFIESPPLAPVRLLDHKSCLDVNAFATSWPENIKKDSMIASVYLPLCLM